jgi:hypothetical protein
VVLRSPRVLRAGDCVLALAVFYRSPNSESVVTRSEKLFRRDGEPAGDTRALLMTVSGATPVWAAAAVLHPIWA